MLRLTLDAAELVRTLVAEAALPPEGGLRIATDPAHRDSLSMRTVPAGEAEDAVVRRNGAQVFLSPQASRRLAHGTLRAEISAQRAVFFLDR